MLNLDIYSWFHVGMMKDKVKDNVYPFLFLAE